MSGFVKLASDLVFSSIWQADPAVCKVWITLLALANCDGRVRGSPGWLAHMARVPQEDCDRALQMFLGPDPSSRTPTNEGRRISEIEGGWQIINYRLHRDRLGKDVSDNPRRTYQREWQRAKRAGVNNCQQVSTPASDSGDNKSLSSLNGMTAEQKQRVIEFALAAHKAVVGASPEAPSQFVVANVLECLRRWPDGETLKIAIEWCGRTRQVHRPNSAEALTDADRVEVWVSMAQKERENPLACR